MQSFVERLLQSASSATTNSRSKTSTAKLVWKQASSGKWIKANTQKRGEKKTKDTCDNPLYSPRSRETPSTFSCGVCDAAMHFRKQDDCCCTICNQACGSIVLVCENCALNVCCNEADDYILDGKWKSSCYNSYFYAAESSREQLYNRQVPVSEFNANDQQRWIQCMWHDIIHNSNTFRAELQHVSGVDTLSVAYVDLIKENLGVEMTKGLVRLFVVFQRKFGTYMINLFSSLIQRDRESLGKAALIASVNLNDRLEQVEWLVLELNVNASSCQLSEVLWIAAMKGRLEILECLVNDAGVDPSADDNYAIRLASGKGHLHVVERLLEDERVNPSAGNNAAIRAASENGHLAVVERFLKDDRVDPSAENSGAFRDASRCGHVSVVERFLQDDRVDPSENDNYAIRKASEYGHLNVVERLLQDDRVDPSAENNYAIRFASRRGQLNVVERLLLDDRVDPAADDNFAIRWATAMGHLSVVERLLLDTRVDPSARYGHAIRRATANGHLVIVEKLLQDDRVDPSARHNYAIRRASADGHVDIVKRLLQDDRVDPSVNDNDAIRRATEYGHLNVVQRLLQDDRVDPTSNRCEALRIATNDSIIKCLYDRTHLFVCFMIDEVTLMTKLTHLHNESLMMGGFCLSHTGSDDKRTTELPQDIIMVILSEWATLVGAQYN